MGIEDSASALLGNVASTKIKTDAALAAKRTATTAGLVSGFMNNAASGMRRMKAEKKADLRRKQQMIASMPFMQAPDLSGLLKGNYGVGSGGGPQGTGAGGGGGLQAKRTDISGLAKGITSLGGDSARQY